MSEKPSAWDRAMSHHEDACKHSRTPDSPAFECVECCADVILAAESAARAPLEAEIAELRAACRELVTAEEEERGESCDRRNVAWNAIRGAADAEPYYTVEKRIRRLEVDLSRSRKDVERARAEGFAEGESKGRREVFEEATRWWDDTEARSSEAHEVYQLEAHRRGDVRHADAYDDLPEATKEWDRVLVRWVARAIRALAAREQEKEKRVNRPANYKRYIGDAVYVDIGAYLGEVVLTTEDGISETNRIVLEPEVLRQLDRWRDEVFGPRKEAQADGEGGDGA